MRNVIKAIREDERQSKKSNLNTSLTVEDLDEFEREDSHTGELSQLISPSIRLGSQDSHEFPVSNEGSVPDSPLTRDSLTHDDVLTETRMQFTSGGVDLPQTILAEITRTVSAALPQELRPLYSAIRPTHRPSRPKPRGRTYMQHTHSSLAKSHRSGANAYRGHADPAPVAPSASFLQPTLASASRLVDTVAQRARLERETIAKASPILGERDRQETLAATRAPSGRSPDFRAALSRAAPQLDQLGQLTSPVRHQSGLSSSGGKDPRSEMATMPPEAYDDQALLGSLKVPPPVRPHMGRSEAALVGTRRRFYKKQMESYARWLLNQVSSLPEGTL
eukprot:gnl/Dysnectes_brevis/115_a137_4565.p1 GENE.gnl/Dysnectes_brevis/115_a137_4565~~gnl/Dysnectes_brevis/115_a137_4565.p1  ORF type:complete len:359 (-),score=82.46 gnl/Dysnectes_brevis/115_a137_4565:38-1042(-)